MIVYQRKARKLGLEIKESTRPGKKFDVYRQGEYQASIGAAGMMDYEKYLKQDGKDIADQRRKAYHARHVHAKTKFRDGKLTAAWLAAKILW